MSIRFIFVLGLFASVIVAAPAGTDVDVPFTEKDKNIRIITPRISDAKEHIGKDLKARGDIFPPPIQLYDDIDVSSAFPWHLFFVVRYRQYPEAQQPPRGLSHSNLYAARLDDKGEVQMEIIATSRELKAFFKNRYRSLHNRITATDAEHIMRAYLKFVQELEQDGFYRFRDDISYVELRGTGRAAEVPSLTGEVVVLTGGKGKLQVSIDFNSIPRIERITELGSIRPGRRPGR